ncbi:unnamed protein product [Ilex paraguariensis]|uniref:TFIIS central domain-containing protein n=1 Tax=Ilex paraguariensis TaxID=185542 RepID=A0ABC8QZ07_9AQUA
MSNNLVSQHLSIPYGQMGQIEAVSDNLDSSILNMRRMELVSGHPASLQVAGSEQQIGLVEPMSNNPGSQNITVLSKQMWQQMKPEVVNLGSQQFLTPNQQVGEMGVMLNNSGSQKLLVPTKRKAEMEPMLNIPMHLHPSMPNKRSTQMLNSPHSPGLAQIHVPSKKAVPMQSISSTPVQNLPATNKRMVRNESISSKSGSQRVQTPKNRSAQMELSPKVQTESFEAVRSKMRESLAAALALASQHQEDISPKEGKNAQGEAALTPRRTQETSQPSEFTSYPAVAVDHVSENAMNTLRATESCGPDRPNDVQSTSVEGSTTEIYRCDGREFQYNCVLPDASFSDNFFVKDDLLQGNGLSWAFEFDTQVPKAGEVPTAEKPMSVVEDVGGDEAKQSMQSPENLAFKIEMELFKLFGGVNKKYKEKGRSLLFNLKDRNNPELRERVMAGEISPERLCSMTAEELASEELSQWRMAKAEELAQMIVLPDSDIDVRRLVKKTHKGDYQIEVEQDDSVSVEVSTQTSSLTKRPPRKKVTVAHSPSETDETRNKENVIAEKSRLENEDFSCSLIIPNDGTDLMQGMIVDELKDAEFLPPIVSLDEFMESLNSEPPFENLPVDAGRTTPLLDKEKLKIGNELGASDLASKGHVDTTKEKADKVDVKRTELAVDLKHTEVAVDVKSSEAPVEQKRLPPGSTSMAEHVWEGAIQLNISTLVNVIGLFRSGEKTSTKEWPSSLEIKGRVRLDAFEKFLQELPMSRSRAVMVVHFVLKEGSSENEHSTLCEVANSYVTDERLGFAEAIPRTELYICPPHTRIVDMISKHLNKDHTEILKSTDNGLIGVVVWRKAHLSATHHSPNSSSHHKHGSKKHQFTSRGEQEKDIHVNSNLASKVPISSGPPRTNPVPPPDDDDGDDDDDDDDDIPPGFGPAAARDEDDLPEFNFSGNVNPSAPKFPSQNHSRGSRMTHLNHHGQASSRPVNQIRDLIHKYGQTGTGVAPSNWQDKRGVGPGIQPWNDNDDEDDDIPEWQPQAPQLQPEPQRSMHGSFQQSMQPFPTNMLKGPQNIAPSWHQGARWVQPPGPRGVQPSSSSSLETQPGAGPHYYGLPALQAGPPGERSRGF